MRMWIFGDPSPDSANQLFLRDVEAQIKLPNGKVISDRREMSLDLCLWTGLSWVGGGRARRHISISSEQNLRASPPACLAIALVYVPLRLPGRILPAGYYLSRLQSGIEVYYRIPEGRILPERCWVEIGEAAVSGWMEIPDQD